jgi:hypothetical protein
MAFEKFTKPGSRIGAPKAAIWSSGQIAFNQGSMDEFNLSKYNYAILYYDRDSKRIGVEFTNDERAEGAHKLVGRKGSSGTSISAIAFLRNYKIGFGETIQYDLTHDKENGLYVFDLKQPKVK